MLGFHENPRVFTLKFLFCITAHWLVFAIKNHAEDHLAHLLRSFTIIIMNHINESYAEVYAINMTRDTVFVVWSTNPCPLLNFYKPFS